MSSRIGSAINSAANQLLHSNENHDRQSPPVGANALPLVNKPTTDPAEQLSLKTGISSDALRSQITAKFIPQPIPAPAPTPANAPATPQPSALEKIWQTVEQTATDVKDTTVAIGSEALARGADAGRQFGTGLIEAERGSIMDVAQGLEQIGSGIEDTLTGALEIGISKPLDEHDTLLSEGWNHLKQGMGEIGSGAYQATIGNVIDNDLLMIGGRTVSAIQTVAGLEQKGRGLDATERAELQKVYGNSIDYDSIRIKEGDSGIPSLISKATNNGQDRAFTHGNTVYMKVNKPDPNDPKYVNNQQQYNADAKEWYSTLVHESCHIWQGQHGGTDYMTKALYGQKYGEGYNFLKGFNESKKWNELNPEQQAELIQEAHKDGYFTTGKFVYTDPNSGQKYNLTGYVNQAVSEIQKGQGAP